MKMTPWFKCADNQPAIAGWYDVWWHGDKRMGGERLYYSSGLWYYSPEDASMFGIYPDKFSGDKWRGLAEQPK